eukprot:MONOS_8521.1-p1 / transcript=MONOS_8521.1 / gene=MONOS_8521 / organism=Monocercomonoides_exilis_PA203 / gene_product=unspecified product / transcript_product=unspecified product / location=Mono_scaffold00323:60869-64875(+) / protein_length=1212 / sequence_SO=supercontig / SO=protein_coding / is_pseudo=false
MLHCCVKTILLFLLAFATISTHVSTHTNEDAECEKHKTVGFDLFGDSQIANSIMHAFPRPHPSYSHFRLSTKHTVAAEFVMANSSAELKWLSIVQVSGKQGVVCTDSSSVRVVECALKLDRSSTKSMFCASRAALVLTNITLSFPFAHSAAQPLISSQPLTHTVQHNSGRVAVESSLIASVCVGAEPFLSPIHVPAIRLASTVFINVTQPHASCADAKRDGGMTEEQHTLIDSCLMDRVENGYDGGIVWGMSVCKGSFTAWNSSFCRSTRTACQRIEHSGSATTDVNECAFHGLKNVEYGGAINHNSTGTCSIQNSEFDDCHAKRAGGACNIIYSSKVTVGTCVFSNCSANEWAGTLKVSFINQLNVDQCNVTNSAAYWAGGTIEATEIRNGSSFSNNIITSGKVNVSNDNETGGGIWCSHTFGMVFSECLFRSCSSENSVGGAMSFSTRVHDYIFTKLSFCFFDGNQASSTGADIYASQEWSTVFSPPAFVGGAKGRDFSACGFAEHPCVSIGKAAGLWFSGSKRSIVLHTGFVWREEIELGGNEWSIQCEEKGDEVGVAPSAPPSHPALITTTHPAQLINVVFALPQTLSQSTTHLLCCKGATLTLTSCGIKTAGGVHSVAFVPLAVTNGKIEATNLVCSAMALAGQPLISVAGAGAEGDFGKLSVESVSTTAECGLLEVANGGSLRVWNSTVSSPTAPLACALLSSASAKAILLQNSTFANFDRAIRNGGCIECTLADGSNLAVAGCSLCECCSRGANGGGMCVEMKSGSHFSVEGSTDADAGGDDGDGRVAGFDTCSALKSAEGEHGRGGGVYVDAEEGATDFAVGDVVFASCTAEKGSSLFVCGYDLLALINEHSLGAHREEADLGKLAGFERCTTDSSFCIPLVVYLWTNFTADGFVDGAGGGDFSRCGFSEAPCRTVDHIVSTRFAPLPQRPSTITIAPGSTITNALNLLPAAAPAAPQLLPSLTMQGAAQAARLSVFDLAPAEQDAFLASAITLTLHSLALCIPAALRQPRAFFCSSSRALCISACSFELREGSMLAYSLILVEEGSFSASQLAIGTDSSATAVSCMPPLVVIHSSGSVSLAGCSVAGVSHSQGNGSWAAAECQGPSARLCIANSTVCGCSAAASDGAGGGLLCSAAGGATVEISNTSFTLCSVPSEGTLAKGLGGGVFLDCAGAASGFQLSNTSFDQCSAWKGKNLSSPAPP